MNRIFCLRFLFRRKKRKNKRKKKFVTQREEIFFFFIFLTFSILFACSRFFFPLPRGGMRNVSTATHCVAERMFDFPKISHSWTKKNESLASLTRRRLTADELEKSYLPTWISVRGIEEASEMLINVEISATKMPRSILKPKNCESFH